MRNAAARSVIGALAALAIGVLATACGAPSDEARIKELLKGSVALAEKKEYAALMESFAPDYADFEGRDKAGAEALVRDYLESYRGVVIHLLGARVDAAGPEGRAAVECEISLSHGAAEVLRKLIRYTGEYYRFRFELEKSGRGEWLFAFAEWQSIGLADLFPESLEILRKLFPDL
jgi:hypothetical protein